MVSWLQFSAIRVVSLDAVVDMAEQIGIHAMAACELVDSVFGFGFDNDAVRVIWFV